MSLYIITYVMCYYMMHYSIIYFDVEIDVSGTINAQLKTEFVIFIIITSSQILFLNILSPLMFNYSFSCE